MELTVDIFNEKKMVSLPDSANVEVLISHFGLLPDNVLVISQDRVLPLDVSLCDGQEIRIIRVSSGG